MTSIEHLVDYNIHNFAKLLAIQDLYYFPHFQGEGAGLRELK